MNPYDVLIRPLLTEKITAIREMKARQLEDYFHLIEGQIRLLSEEPVVVEVL